MSLSGHILIEHDVYYKRIESWWSRLRNFKTEWWIQLFKVSNYIHVGVCMLYSYLMHRTWMRRACLTLQIFMHRYIAYFYLLPYTTCTLPSLDI